MLLDQMRVLPSLSHEESPLHRLLPKLHTIETQSLEKRFVYSFDDPFLIIFNYLGWLQIPIFKCDKRRNKIDLYYGRNASQRIC
jgi:hypothetical protein